jgi:Zn-dependent protease with chaperone function
MSPLQRPALNIALLALTLLYVVSTGLMMLACGQLLLKAMNRTLPVPGAWMLLWLLLTATASRWYVALRSLLLHQRRPIAEESDVIACAVAELQSSIAEPVSVRVWVEESEGISAAAWGEKSWTVSTGALAKLTTRELAAVFAHEHGHHRAGDTRMRAARALCHGINHQLQRPGKLLIRCTTRLRCFGCTILLVVLLVLTLCNYFAPVLLLAAVLLPAWLVPLCEKVLRPLDLWITRRNEYKQDAYACRLGLGEHLRTALLKIAREDAPQQISWWTVTFHRTHPLTHDRIRRLDERTAKGG